MRLQLLESSDNDWMQHPAFRRLLHMGIFSDATISNIIQRAKTSRSPYKSVAKDLKKIHDDAYIRISNSSNPSVHADDIKRLDYIRDIISELSAIEISKQLPSVSPFKTDWTENTAIKQLEQFFKNPKDYYKLLEDANEADNPYAVVYSSCKAKRDKIDPADIIINKSEIEKLDAVLEQLKELAERNQTPNDKADEEKPAETNTEKPKDDKPSFASEFWQGIKGNKDKPRAKGKGLISKAVSGMGKSIKNKLKRAKRSWKAGHRGDIGSILSNAFTGNDRYDSDRLERLYDRRNRRK